MNAVNLCALSTIRLLTPKRCAEQHADGCSTGQPGTDLSCGYAGSRSQRGSQGKSYSCVA